MKQYNYIHQSPWIQDYYNQLKFDSKIGVLLEIGVGNVIDYPNRDYYQKNQIKHTVDNYTRLHSNTAELLDLDWSGIYIDPIYEYLNQCKILHKNNLSRLKLINCGASDKNEDVIIGDYESLISSNHNLVETCYHNRSISCYYTNDILVQHCPDRIDLFSLDVEGMEDRILKSIDFNRFKFNMIIVEINSVSHHTISSILPNYYVNAKMDDLNAVYINTSY